MSKYVAPQRAPRKRSLAHRAKTFLATTPLLLAPLLIITNAPASAAPSNNPNFATLEYVQNAINNAANIGLAPIQNAITNLQQQQAAQATQITNLQGSLASLQSLETNEDALFSNLQNSIASLQTQQSNNTSQINILQTSVSTIQSQQTNTASQISDLQTQETNETSLLTNLQNQLTTQLAAITNLQNAASPSLKAYDANGQEPGLAVGPGGRQATVFLKVLKARVALSLYRAYGRVPKEQEIDQAYRLTLTRSLYDAVPGMLVLQKQPTGQLGLF